MEHAFVDTTFFVARFNRKDRKHGEAMSFLSGQRTEAAPYRLVTTDYVFDETVTTMLFQSGRHDVAATAGRAIKDSAALRLLRIDESAFDAAWALFLDRPDKRWSFTDCSSFVLMNRLDLRVALSFDRNFREAGYGTLP